MSFSVGTAPGAAMQLEHFLADALGRKAVEACLRWRTQAASPAASGVPSP